MNFMKKSIEDGIKEFNKWRSPEAKAKLISIENGKIKVKFSGPFCLSCGIYDYFEDLRIFLEEKKIKVKIEKIEEKEDGFLVTFRCSNEANRGA